MFLATFESLTKQEIQQVVRDLPHQMGAGPQREIFLGGTKTDSGPPKLGEELTNKSKKGLHSNLVPFFAQN